MRAKILLVIIVAAVLIVLGTSWIVLTNARWLVVQGRLLGGAATPETAVRDMLQVQRNGLRDILILGDEWIGLRRLVVFSYAVQPPGEPPHDEFGYALTEMRRGWSASPGPLHAVAAPPNLMSYATANINGVTMIYGKVMDPRITVVEVVFAGAVEQVSIHRGGFVLLNHSGGQVTTLRGLDSSGHVLQSAVGPELYAPPRWR